MCILEQILRAYFQIVSDGYHQNTKVQCANMQHLTYGVEKYSVQVVTQSGGLPEVKCVRQAHGNQG